MANNKRIKGITIEIGSDTVGLQKALSDVNKKSNKLKSELQDVERLLKFNPGNVEAIAQKQKLLSEQITVTSDKLNKLKEAEKQVQAQFQKGDISEEQYRAFRREIEFTEGSLDGLNNKLADMKTEQDKAANSTKQLETLLKATNISAENLSDALGDKLTKALLNGKATSKQLEEALQKIGQEALGTTVDLDKMKKALSSVDDGASLKSVKKELNALSKEAKSAKESVGEVGLELENVAGALIAGGGFSGTIEQALNTSALNTKIDISFDVSEESKTAIIDAVNIVKSYGIEGEEALEGIRRQWALNKDATDEVNAAVVTMAGTITTAFSGIDFNELIQEGNEIAATLGITNEEAMGLVNTLLKTGFPPEQLDIIAEYGDQMMQAGFSAKEVQAIMAAGVDTKSWNIDNLLDGVKEGRIRMADFGNGLNKEMQGLISQTNISAEKFVSWGQAIAEGGEGGQQAMLEATKALAQVEDATIRNQLGTQMFGTMWEDQGAKIIETITNAADKQVNLKNGIDDINSSTASMNSDPAVQLSQAFSDMAVALQPLLLMIAELVSKLAEWISNNPTLAATIAAIVTGIGILVGALFALAPILTMITGLSAALGVSVTAVTWPILAVIAAIVALIAIGVALYKNWDTVKAKSIELYNSLGPFKGIISAMLGPVGALIAIGVKLYKNWDTIKEKASELREKITNLFNGIKWELPKLKLPHFSLTGKFDLKTLSVPKLNVEWYDKGGVFYGPQVIGVGEKRPEFVGALDDLRKIVREESGSSSNPVFNITLNYNGSENNEDAYKMVDIIERELAKRMQLNAVFDGVRV